MQSFKIKEGGFDEIKKTMVLRLLRGVGISIGIGGVMAGLNYMNKGGDIKIILIPFAMLILFSAYRVFSEIGRQRLLFGSYTLTVIDNLIRREQLNTPIIEIDRNDIKAINKHPNGSFKITGKSDRDVIVIPAQVTGYDEIEQLLKDIMPISLDEKKSFTEKNKQLIGTFNVLLIFFLFAVQDKPTVIVISSIIIGSTLWSIAQVQRNKNIDYTTKRKSLWGLLTIASVVVSVIIKFYS